MRVIRWISCAVPLCLMGTGCDGLMDLDLTGGSSRGSGLGSGGGSEEGRPEWPRPSAYVLEGCPFPPTEPGRVWMMSSALLSRMNRVPIFANVGSSELTEFSLTVHLPPPTEVGFLGVRPPVVSPEWDVYFDRDGQVVSIYGLCPPIDPGTSEVRLALLEFQARDGVRGHGTVELTDLGHGIARYEVCTP